MARSRSVPILQFIVTIAIGGGAPTAAQASEATLEEVVVTARKRTEEVQDIPDAVQVFTARDIEAAGIAQTKDFFDLTPNIEMQNDQNPTIVTITIRGVSQNRDGQAPVAFVVDGVTLPDAAFFDQELFDIQQIEILKGPQGALYGRNSIGGAINITTKEPTDDLEFTGRASYAEGNDSMASVSASGPIVDDRLLFRVSALWRESDGLIDNEFRDTEVDFLTRKTAKAKLLWLPTDSLRIDLRGSYDDLDSGAGYYRPKELGPYNDTVNEVVADVIGTSPRRMWETSLKADWETTAGTLTSITSYDDVYEDNYQDVDYVAVSILDIHQLTDIRSLTQELRFTSPDDRRLRWLVGAFYQDIDRDFDNIGLVNVNGPLFGGAGVPEERAYFELPFSLVEQDIEAYAFFGQVNFDVTDALELTLGLRYDEEERRFFDRTEPAPREPRTFDSLQPKVSLAWKVTPDALLYATYARGFRPGGFNTADFAGLEYDEETTSNYELGFKSSWLRNTLTFNGAVFYIDYQDQQFFVLDAVDFNRALFNGDESEIKGFELEATYAPSDRWRFQLGYGYTDGEITHFGDLEGLPVDTATLDGNHLPKTSQSEVNFAIDFRQPLTSSLALVAHADYRHNGRIYWELDNFDSQDPYDVVNLRVGIEGNRWRVSAFGRNVFDEDFDVAYFSKEWSGIASQIDVGWPGVPRQIGIEVAASF